MPEERADDALPERAISATTINIPRALLKTMRYRFLFMEISLLNFWQINR